MSRRTGQPVRRSSVNAGTVEHRIWHPFSPDEKGPRMKAAEQFDRQHKLPGCRNGPLGHIGLDVLRELQRIIDYRSGRLEPTIAYLMNRLKRSRAAIVAALTRLRTHGFLDWVRRTVPLENDGPGPQVAQTSNAYWFKLPGHCVAFVRRLIGKAPREAKERAQIIAEARAERSEQMRARRPGILAADVLSEGAKEAVRRLAERRSSASSPNGLNPALKG